MLTVNDLESFEEYITSGQLEQDFKDGCENDRFYLLELLEKLMDLSDLADETATQLIFRGLPLSPPPSPQAGSNGAPPQDS